MREVLGSLVLRLGQAFFSTISFFIMFIDMDCCTVFRWLVTVMHWVVVPWSTTLALVDGYYLFVKRRRPDRQFGCMTLVIIGDSVLSFLSLAAATSTASVALSPDLVDRLECDTYTYTLPALSAGFAFLSWSLLLTSTLVNIWGLPGL